MHFSIKKTAGVFLVFLFLGIQLQADGIVFFEGEWKDVLQIAKKERKLIFVDAYATWCGPCKMMARNSFPVDQVGDYFNANFINYKMDVDKGEGPGFANQYGIASLPTLLFINYKGEVVHKAIGYRGPNELLTEGKKANSPQKNQDQYALAYEAGSNDPEILFHYAMNQAAAKEDYREAAERYFGTQEEKALIKDERNWKAIELLTTDIESREYQYLLNKQKKFMKKYGTQAVANKIYNVLKSYTLQGALIKDESRYLLAVQTAQEYIHDDGKTANRLKMVYHEATKDWDLYAQKAAYHFDSFIITQPKELSNAAWNFYLHVDDTEMLEKALAWTRQSIAIENQYYNNKVFAYLQYKIGNEHEARKAAFKTMKIAELNDLNPEEMEDLLEKINEMN